MAELGSKDLNAVLEYSLEAQAAADMASLRRALVPGLMRLVPCDSIGYNEVDLERGTALGITDPPEAMFDGIEECLLATAHQHPLIARSTAGETSAALISDYLTTRQYHRLELYNDFYKRIDTEDQLAFGLPGEVIVAVAINRSRRSFTDRDKQVIELIRPNLAAAFKAVRECERVKALMSSLEHRLEERGAGIVQLDRSGRVAHASEAARELLAAYCGASAPRLEPAEATIDGPRGSLRVRPIETGEGQWPVLLLEEQRTAAPSVASLTELGLTTRQAQVTRLLVRGKRNEQIARELQISPTTVAKHLERIYRWLEVSSRSEAIARVLSL